MTRSSIGFLMVLAASAAYAQLPKPAAQPVKLVLSADEEAHRQYLEEKRKRIQAEMDKAQLEQQLATEKYVTELNEFVDKVQRAHKNSNAKFDLINFQFLIVPEENKEPKEDKKEDKR